MRRLATAAIICAALTGTAQAQTPTAVQVLAGSRWGWLGFEHDLTKIPESDILATSKTACVTPKLVFNRQGDQLVKLDYVVDPPSPTTYPKTQVIVKDGRTLIAAFYSETGTKPDTAFLLSRGNTILSIPDKTFGTWHYVRCLEPGRTYDVPAGTGAGR